MRWRSAARRTAHRAGILRAWHQLRHRDTLTVLTFHRVLPREEFVRLEADPAYTLTSKMFVAILGFLRQRYQIVDLAAVLAAREGKQRLPPYALLVTLDDGWVDSRDHAAPLLQAAGVPAVVFAATDALQETGLWWQEVLLWALRSGQASFEQLFDRAGVDLTMPRAVADPDPSLALLVRYGTLGRARRDALLDPYRQMMVARQPGRQMIESDDFERLSGHGIMVGAHGAAHLPLTLVDDPGCDLRRATEWLTQHGAPTGGTVLSFPHGRYNGAVAEAARQSGYKLMFTSDAILNESPAGWLKSDLLGRITVASSDICDLAEDLSPERLATWLFLRERATLRAPGAAAPP